MDDLQAQCERGQQQLMATDYLAAEQTLAAAEQVAWDTRDFETFARLLMPLQEARRQKRQRCGEGEVCLDLIAQSETDHIDGGRIIENYLHGQLLVAGWGSIEPAVKARQLAAEKQLYVEAFLAAVYPIGSGRVIVIVPSQDVRVPEANASSVDDLVRRLPPHSIIVSENELPRGSRKGTTETFAQVMAMWERLHAPFLAAADMQVDSLKKIEGYRQTIRVDYACELAHQKASNTAREIARSRRSS